MKRILLVSLCALAISAHAQTTSVTIQPPAQGISNDFTPPEGYPPFLMVKNQPLGSGIPMLGLTTGYSRADHVRDGLYHVPNYLPGGVPAYQVDAQVVTLRCMESTSGLYLGKDGRPYPTWICDGYTINPEIGRGENILIQPILVK